MIIEELYKIKRGIIIAVDEPTPVPTNGEIYSCGDDSYVIREVEKIKNGCFGKGKDSYLFLINLIGNSKLPMRGYILDRVENHSMFTDD